jgi:hypothetical protein
MRALASTVEAWRLVRPVLTGLALAHSLAVALQVVAIHTMKIGIHLWRKACPRSDMRAPEPSP